MRDKEALRQVVRDNLDSIVADVNAVLAGKTVRPLRDVLERLGGGKSPHWLDGLVKRGSLPNLDGKTIGSVVETILVAVLETTIFSGLDVPRLRLNPTRGVDLPDLDLGVKSPSENYCTSEPFFSAYERLLGSEHDVLVLLTDYQTAKRRPPLKLRIVKWRYLHRSQMADRGLCAIAVKTRDWLMDKNVSWAKKACRFLAYVNQSDWRAKHLLAFLDDVRDMDGIRRRVVATEEDFERTNILRASRNLPALDPAELVAIQQIGGIEPLHLGVIDAADNWVVETLRDAGRFPNENEWNRYLVSPLDGRIGMSFALQWRYNFSRLFGENDDA